MKKKLFFLCSLILITSSCPNLCMTRKQLNTIKEGDFLQLRVAKSFITSDYTKSVKALLSEQEVLISLALGKTYESLTKKQPHLLTFLKKQKDFRAMFSQENLATTETIKQIIITNIRETQDSTDTSINQNIVNSCLSELHVAARIGWRAYVLKEIGTTAKL